MPFALIIIGVVMLVAAARNSQTDLFNLVKGDFSGDGNFVYWLVLLLIVGAVGYIEKLKPLSEAFLILILIVIVLKKGNTSGTGGGLFEQFTSALKSTTGAGANVTQQTASVIPSLPSLPSLSV